MEGLKSRLLARKTIQPRFRLPTTTEQANDILLAAYKAEVESRHRTFVDDGKTRANINKLAEFLTNESPKFGIMFCGICGNGKTTMIHALQSALNYMSDYNAFNSERKGIRIIDAKDVTAYARDTKNFSSLRITEMLAIEDMGREPTEILDYGNILNPVIDLLEYRYNQQLFTIITTNMRAEDIREKYGDRIADRFNEMLNVIIFGNASYRK